MKLKLTIILNLIAFGLSFGSGFIYYQIELLREKEMAREYSSLVSHLLWSLNKEAIDSFLKGALSNENHLEIKIYDESNVLYAEASQDHLRHTFFPWWKNKLVFTNEITRGPAYLGRFELVIHDHERSAQFLCLLVFLVFHVAIYFIVALFESRKKNQELEGQIIHSERLAAIGTMGAGIAHEINNPLTVVMGHAFLLQETINKKYSNDPLLLNMIGKVISSVERIKKIVEHMKDFSRNSVVDTRVSMTAKQLIDDTLIFVMPILQKNQVNLTLKIDENLPEMSVNRVELESVMQNLLVNAKDALLNRTSDRMIIVKVTYKEDEKFIEFSITDNGQGIPKDKIGKIFDPFFTTKDVGRGTGLGLAITKKIVDKHQGTIWVSSKVNEGTTFIVTIPVGVRND